MASLLANFKTDPGPMLYNQRAYYKISLIRGKSIAEYADKVIDIEMNALLLQHLKYLITGFRRQRIRTATSASLPRSSWFSQKVELFWMNFRYSV